MPREQAKLDMAFAQFSNKVCLQLLSSIGSEGHPSATRESPFSLPASG